ncbi:hypothetical protein PV325_000257 [Microctonus aethiopoides]|nr:hypothetical protein PV325_000257 [Microctonus aethiopoides]
MGPVSLPGLYVLEDVACLAVFVVLGFRAADEIGKATALGITGFQDKASALAFNRPGGFTESIHLSGS